LSYFFFYFQIIPDQYENSYQPEFRVEAIDSEKNMIKLTNEIVEITQTKDEFQLDWKIDNEDTTVIVEIPIGSSENLEINAKVQKGDIKIDNVPTATKIVTLAEDGMVRLKGIRANSVDVNANKILMQEVYAVDINLKEFEKDKGYLIIEQCQANNIRAIGENVNVQSVYANNIEVQTTEDSLLKNLHGNAVVYATGAVLNTVGFSGTLNAVSKCKKTMLHFAELHNDSNVKIDHPEGDIQLGFTNQVATETTDIHIHSLCPIATKSKEFVVCQRAESEFEVIRKNADADSTLKIEVKSGKEVKMIKQSWIESINFDF
jgi:hypothetical protein